MSESKLSLTNDLRNVCHPLSDLAAAERNDMVKSDYVDGKPSMIELLRIYVFHLTVRVEVHRHSIGMLMLSFIWEK